jgi:hypothetical protein
MTCRSLFDQNKLLFNSLEGICGETVVGRYGRQTIRGMFKQADRDSDDPRLVGFPLFELLSFNKWSKGYINSSAKAVRIKNGSVITVLAENGMAITCAPFTQFMAKDQEFSPLCDLKTGGSIFVCGNYLSHGGKDELPGIKSVEIIAIQPCEARDFYCIEVAEPDSNFVANGFILGNAKR